MPTLPTFLEEEENEIREYLLVSWGPKAPALEQGGEIEADLPGAFFPILNQQSFQTTLPSPRDKEKQMIASRRRVVELHHPFYVLSVHSLPYLARLAKIITRIVVPQFYPLCSIRLPLEVELFLALSSERPFVDSDMVSMRWFEDPSGIVCASAHVEGRL